MYDRIGKSGLTLYRQSNMNHANKDNSAVKVYIARSISKNISYEIRLFAKEMANDIISNFANSGE